jgi:hypothetical protein
MTAQHDAQGLLRSVQARSGRSRRRHSETGVASLFPLLFAAKKQPACCTLSRNLSCFERPNGITARMFAVLRGKTAK